MISLKSQVLMKALNMSNEWPVFKSLVINLTKNILTLTLDYKLLILSVNLDHRFKLAFENFRAAEK